MKTPQTLLLLLTLHTLLSLTTPQSSPTSPPPPTNSTAPSPLTPQPPTCNFGQFLHNNNTCIQCLLSCSKCTSLLYCDGCSEGFRLGKNDACQGCGVGELRCDQSVVVCQRYYLYQGNRCKPRCVVEHCGKCQSIFTKQCQECQPNHTLSATKTQCLPPQPRNLQQTPTQPTSPTPTPTQPNPTPTPTPLSCPLSQYLSPTTLSCQPCHQKCSTCLNTATQCLSCSQGWVMMGWKCVTEEHLVYWLLVKVGTEGGLREFDLAEVNRIKRDIVDGYFGEEYRGIGLGVLGVSSLGFDFNSSTVNITGVADKVGNRTLQSISQTLQSNLKTTPKIGPHLLQSFSVKTSTPPPAPPSPSTSNSTSPPPQSNVSNSTSPAPSDSKQQSTPDLKAILIPAIVLGGLLVVGLCVGICACFRWWCFGEKKDDGDVQVLDSERKPTNQLQSAQKMPIITPITPIPPTNPINPSDHPLNHPINPSDHPLNQPLSHPQKYAQKIQSVTSINISPPQLPEDPDKQKKIQKIVSLDSLDQMLSKNPPTPNKEKLKLNLNKEYTLKDSQLDDKEIRNIIPSSSNSRMSEGYDLSGKTARGVRDSQKYYYVDQKGKVVEVKNIPEHLINSQYIHQLPSQTGPKFS